jgi:predicted glycogen debranching enzyme
MINFDETICTDLSAARTREWLETNGLGGFASATITGQNTRRYHGLLVAARRPPTERMMLLSKLEETLIINGEAVELSTNQYPGTVHPQGYRHLRGFRLDPFPVFTFRVGEVELEKTVLMLRGDNTTVVRYRLTAPPDAAAKLVLRPLVAFRDYHALQRESDPPPFVDIEEGLVRVAPAGSDMVLHLAHDAATVYGESVWYRNFEYLEEQARGFDFREDLFNPCALSFELKNGQFANVIASARRHKAAEAGDFAHHEQARRHAYKGAQETDEYVRALYAAANQFIVRRGRDRATVIAGYHWFTDWGRDTMIALPGLALTTERHDIARDILLAFAEHVSRGMIPNRFPDTAGDAPEYNTADATLWFFHAVHQYLERTGDETFVHEHLYTHLREIINWHERGTRYRIKVDTDGLLHTGEAGVQLTWMDAKVGDWVVTPRTGKPVEIQALWYNALCVMSNLAVRFHDAATNSQCALLASRALAAFNDKFWHDEGGYLYDVLNDDGTADASLRPNQIFAASLPFTMLAPERMRAVVAAVEDSLLTPYGLRSLAPQHPDYRPRYEGDSLSRDGSYHQGTVWAWLIGPFITAYLKTHQHAPAAKEQARAWLAAFRAHLCEAGLGQVSEIFDADPPHTPRGCIAQAWSVAELLRCEVEELG